MFSRVLEYQEAQFRFVVQASRFGGYPGGKAAGWSMIPMGAMGVSILEEGEFASVKVCRCWKCSLNAPPAETRCMASCKSSRSAAF